MSYFRCVFLPCTTKSTMYVFAVQWILKLGCTEISPLDGALASSLVVWMNELRPYSYCTLQKRTINFICLFKKQTKALYYFIFYYSSFIVPCTCTIELSRWKWNEFILPVMCMSVFFFVFSAHTHTNIRTGRSSWDSTRICSWPQCIKGHLLPRLTLLSLYN